MTIVFRALSLTIVFCLLCEILLQKLHPSVCTRRKSCTRPGMCQHSHGLCLKKRVLVHECLLHNRLHELRTCPHLHPLRQCTTQGAFVCTCLYQHYTPCVIFWGSGTQILCKSRVTFQQLPFWPQRCSQDVLQTLPIICLRLDKAVAHTASVAYMHLLMSCHRCTLTQEGAGNGDNACAEQFMKTPCQ